ncbi:alpha/beta fold hydrolase [Streptomyces sp. NPDC017936]|uniref:alpha/beta fold hydrolase n=1 Tax=Streptomyces sp. NPDC017936 TaxID=3365016 RepID=UPI00379B02DA
MPRTDNPTVVLVHGAFADASGFARVIPALIARGLDVVAPAVPHRGLLGDSAYVASIVREVDGPVVLVGHSYGGAVITVAGVEDNVRALVFVAGYALDEGESVGELQGGFPDSDLATALVRTPFPDGDSVAAGADLSVGIDRFPSVLAADVDPRVAAVLAVSQRPLAARACAEQAPAAAWRTKASWGLVATADRAVDPEAQRYGYRRAGMAVAEVDSSHLVMLAHPERVVELIEEAVRATVR